VLRRTVFRDTADKPRSFDYAGFMRDPDERFWEKVNKDGPLRPGMNSPCWEWIARIGTHGYGEFRALGHNLAHRYSWSRENGSIPTGLDIDHICRNRACVNPGHLRCGPRKRNAENLDAAATSANTTSRFRGVSFHKQTGRWRAQVTHHQKQYYGGAYETEEEAAEAARQLRLKLFTFNHSDDRDREEPAPLTIGQKKRLIRPPKPKPTRGRGEWGSSQYRGVFWVKDKRRWRARVKLNGKRYDAGYFDNEQEAAEAARLLRERLGVK